MITSTTNRNVKLVRALQTRRRTRWEQGLFVIEGVRLAYEVIAEGLPVHSVFHTDTLSERGKGLVNTLARHGAEVYMVSEGVMKAASDTESHPGILLTLQMPKISPIDMFNFALVIDRLPDPEHQQTI